MATEEGDSERRPLNGKNGDSTRLGPAGAPSPPVSPGDYAPSPNTSSQALTRAQQLRVQNLLRKLLLELDENVRLDTLRVLRKTLRELDFQLSWLTQVDLLETLERVLRNSSESHVAPREDCDEEEDFASWRLVHDATQLLIESVARLPHELDQQLVESVAPNVVENLGHQRSEVRRASLLLLNALLQQHQNTRSPARANLFKLILRLFIDYGLTNYRNKQAQRGAILSLPLLMSEQLVRREDLEPLVRCLSELMLVDSNEQLFYSLYLAMQRLHLMMGDDKFHALLARCEPEAARLYRQAASRQNSLVSPDGGQPASLPAHSGAGGHKQRLGSTQQQAHCGAQQAQVIVPSSAPHKTQTPVEREQHVTFESSASGAESEDEPRAQGGAEQPDADQQGREVPAGEEEEAEAGEPRPSDSRQSRRDRDDDGELGGPVFSSSFTTDESESETGGAGGRQRVGVAEGVGRQFSSDVSSTCSSDAHLVNPAHYMTKAALAGNPLDHYEEIHHVDHSNMQSLAINDFGPICNTPTMEFAPQLAGGIQSSLAHHYKYLESQPVVRAATAAASLPSELKFGIFPKHLIQVALQSPRASDRYEAMQELMCIVRESPVNHLAILMTYFDSFLEQFLAKIMLNQQRDSARAGRQPTGDFKLELIAIDMIETIIIKTKVSTMQYIRPIVSLLMRALIVDSQQQQQPQPVAPQSSHHQLTGAPSIFRESTCRAVHKMMAYLPPQHVIDALFEHKHQRAPVVREEAVNRVTAAILEYDRQEFNLTKLCYHILPMLADPSASVRLASLECIATLAHALGPERIGSLLTAAEAVQSGCDYDGLLLGAINARLMRHTLPRCQSNGVVRYALKPHLGLSAAGDRNKLAADVRWVLEAPSAHQQHPGGPYYHPRAHHGHNHGQSQGATDHLRQQKQQQQPQAHTNEPDDHHQHHRLGVYSPPTQAERRRRSSVGLGLMQQQQQHGELPVGDQDAPGSHRHHHSIARHRSRSVVAAGQSSRSLDQETEARSGRSNSDHSKAEVQTHKNGLSSSSLSSGGGGGGTGSQDKSETHEQQSRAQASVAKKNSESEQPIAKRRESRVASLGAAAVAPGRRRESAGKVEQSPTIAPGECDCKKHHQQTSEVGGSRQQATPGYKRSNSQDSVSSTDTNKVLFQYYLCKFRQSLAESPGNQAVLPSDSIIYTDVEHAYELTRHRTRFQQTSFDYAPDSVGQVPEGLPPAVGPDTSGGGRRRKSTTGASEQKNTIVSNNNNNQQQDNMSQRPRPEVDDCPTSGSESPQTVFENPKRNASLESQQSQAQAQPRQRPILTRSGKSIQRQATIERDHPELELEPEASPRPQEAREERSPTPAASRRQSVASNASGPTRRQRHASSVQSSRAGSLGDDQHEQQPQPGSGRESRANSGPTSDEFAPRRQRSQSVASRASSMAAEPQVVEQAESSREDLADGGGETVASATASSSTANSDTSRPSTEGGVEQRSSGRERRRRRSGSQRRRTEEAAAAAARPPSDIGDGGRAVESGKLHERHRASRSQPPVARARPAAADGSQQAAGNSQDQPRPTGVKLVPIRQQQGCGATPAAGDSRRACSVSPSLSNSVNIRHILENVAQAEGPFAEPQLAHKVALSALDSPCWSTKVEGILALIRLVAFHAQPVVLSAHEPGRLHEIVTKVADETRNLRSTVARSAIFALGDFCARLERAIEPELDLIVHALLLKSNENTAFIRDDIRRSLAQLVDHLTPWRLASALLHHGAQHKSVHVRRMASQFVAALVERLGPARCLVGAREISAQLLPAAARFAQDQSPHTRFHGRLILAKLMHHNSFERLLRRTLTSQLYRSAIGIIESVKRRGPGEPPADLA